MTDEGIGKLVGTAIGAAVVSGVMAYLGGQAQMNGQVSAARRSERMAHNEERAAQMGHHEMMQAWVSCEIERRECSERCGE